VPAREAVLRIVGEAVTNAVRHGRARDIRVQLADRPNLQVRVVDDGVGFDPRVLRQGSGGHGLVSMRERAEQVGARLRVESRLGQGTRIIVDLP
jgi:signal transduction histidine kinase